MRTPTELSIFYRHDEDAWTAIIPEFGVSATEETKADARALVLDSVAKVMAFRRQAEQKGFPEEVTAELKPEILCLHLMPHGALGSSAVAALIDATRILRAKAEAAVLEESLLPDLDEARKHLRFVEGFARAAGMDVERIIDPTAQLSTLRSEEQIRELYERVHDAVKKNQDEWGLLHMLDWILGVSDADPLTGDIPMSEEHPTE